MPRPSTTRKRQLAGPRGFSKGTSSFAGGTPQILFDYSFDVRGKQVTVSESHEWPPPLGEAMIDRGGPFYTTKSYLASPRVLPYTKVKGQGLTPSYLDEFNGVVLPALGGLATSNWSGLMPPTLESSDAELDAKGATAISRCKPTKSIASLGTTLGETLREGLPALVGRSLLEKKTKSLLGKGAGEFLNYSFGWQPLVSDVRKAADALRRSDEILKQYERDAGRVVRRNYYFPLEKTESEITWYTNSYPLGFGSFLNLRTGLNGKCVQRRVVERKTWFSGAFTYYLPSDYDSRNKIKELRTKADILLGTDLTPELLWNLAPWSWLADWFANTGDVISNLSDFKTGELIMRYGYVMETVKVSDTYTHYATGNNPYSLRVAAPTFVTETKKRRPANPFGFGLTWEGLSSFQQAILAALGITRATR
jgi:hypothetical protein